MDVNIQEVLKATGGVVLEKKAVSSSWQINKISTDTRTIEKDDLFFALEGEKFDAHDFLEEAATKGAKHLVVSKPKSVSEKIRKHLNVIVVEDTLKAYGDLAKFYRQKFKIPVIAITGSSGKTTVKEILAHLLSSKYKVLKNRGTENNRIGVPKTIFQLEPSHEALVLEIGTSEPGEIERLSSIVAPQIGILTMIGPSHLEGLGSLEGVREEKMKIILGLERGGKLILNGEDLMLKGAQSGTHRLIRFGFSNENADWIAEQIWSHEKGCNFQVNGKEMYETQLFGRHNVLNALAAIIAASHLEVEAPALQKALASFKPVTGRFNLKEVEGITFIDDSYNSNPGSLQAALETLKNFKTRGRKGIVIGDMLELGQKSEELHRQMGKLAASLPLDYIIAAGPLSAYFAEEALSQGYPTSKLHEAKDSDEAGQILKKLAQAGDMVLVKGSRGMRMEKVFECYTTSFTR